MVWQKDVCQRRDLLDLQIDDTGMGGVACLPEKEYGVDAVRPPSRESVVADRLHTAVSGLADALQSTVAVFEGRGRTLRPVSSTMRGASLPSIADIAALPVGALEPAITTLGGTRWTLVRLPGSRHAGMLAVHGDQSHAPETVAVAAAAVTALLAE